MTEPSFTRRTPPTANFSSAAVARKPPPPPPPPGPTEATPDTTEPYDSTTAPETAAPTIQGETPPDETPTEAAQVDEQRRQPQTAKETANARRPRATTAPTARRPTGDGRYGFRPVTIGLSPDAIDWFDQQKLSYSSQRAFLLELVAEYGPAVVPVGDTINVRRVQLGLSPTRPAARQGRMVSINISMHHDEAVVLDNAADQSGRSRAAYCEELIKLARQAKRQG